MATGMNVPPSDDSEAESLLPEDRWLTVPPSDPFLLEPILGSSD